MPKSFISAVLMIPSGFIMNEPLKAKPSSSIITSKFLDIAPVGSPIIGNFIFLIVSDVSCQALCVKCVSVDTAYTSTPIFCNSS